MQDEREEQQWAARAYGPPHMRMIELPVAAVVVDPALNCRQYTPDDIKEACEQFEAQPMLHAPTVARVEGEWRLVAGFRRFAVWQVKGIEQGVFRWIDAPDAIALLVANLVENIGRRDLRPHELVESLVRLHEHGLDAYEIADRCKRSDRWVRRLLALKRSAHPELWTMFVARVSPHLTMARMLDLSDHPRETQLARWRELLAAAESADEHARGYRDSGSGDPRLPRGPRRRLPARRQAERKRRSVESESALDPMYRRGVLAAFDWLLRGTEIPLELEEAETDDQAAE